MLDVWHVMAGTEKKRGVGNNPTSPDTFVLGTTMPVWKGTNNVDNNVGCLFGVSRTTVGSLTQSNGAVHQNLNIPFQVTITQPNQTFINCRFTFSYIGTGNGGMAYVMSSVATNIRFERCEFEPTTPNDRYNGIYGHHFTAYRCAITKTVDGFGVYNQSAQPVQVKVHGSWIGHLSWFDDDRGAHNDGTHNDGIQHGSGTGLEVIGNFWQGAKYNALNPNNCTLTADGMSYVIANGNGVTPLSEGQPWSSNRMPQQGQIFLTQHSAYFLVDNITYRNNWLWNFGGSAGFKAMSNATYLGPGQKRYIYNIAFEDNIFGGKPFYHGYSYSYIPIRYDTNIYLNGVKQNAATNSLVDTHNNRYAADANVNPTYPGGGTIAGNLIRHYVDLVTVP